MKNSDTQSVDLPTYAVLVSATGEILDVRTHHRASDAAASKLVGKSYSNECASRYRPAIKGLLSRERQLLSAVMPPPTLGIDAWFAVVGVPLSASKESGALFVHMDVSNWVANSGAKPSQPKKLSMDLVQRAMATTFIGADADEATGRKSKSHYDGVDALSARQREVLDLIGKGLSNAEISETLSCSLNTVKRHVTAVLQKLRVPNRTRAAMVISQMDRDQKE